MCLAGEQVLQGRGNHAQALKPTNATAAILAWGEGDVISHEASRGAASIYPPLPRRGSKTV